MRRGDHLPALARVAQLVARVTDTQLALLVPAAGAIGSQISAGEAAAVEALGVRSLILVPLLARTRVSGVLALATTSAERGFGAAELALGTEIGRRASRFIGTAQLYGDALRATHARDEVMALVSHDLGGTAAAIAMAASALLDAGQRQAAEASDRGQVELIRRSAESIQRMVRDCSTPPHRDGTPAHRGAPWRPPILVRDARRWCNPRGSTPGWPSRFTSPRGGGARRSRSCPAGHRQPRPHALRVSERGGVVPLSVTPQATTGPSSPSATVAQACAG